MGKRASSVAVQIVALLGIVAIAAFFRFYRLDAIPCGLYFDEAGQGLDALDALSGHLRLFSPRSDGHEPLYGYLVAGLVFILGRIPLAVRLPAALSELVAVAMIYMLGREMFLTEGERISRRIAIIAMLLLSTSYWAVTISRIGFPSSLIPMFALTSFYFFWRGWNRQLVDGSGASFFGLPLEAFRDFCLAGIFLGLSLYTYIPSRFLPLVIASFVFWSIAMSGGESEEGGRCTRFAVRGFILITLSALLVFTPLGLYFLSHPNDFMRKASTVSVFNPDVNEGQPLRTLMGGALRTLRMFVLGGDPNIRHNPGQRSIFDPFMAVWFVIGLGTSFLNWRKPPYLFAILWFSIMLLPTVLSVGAVPHWFRAIGSLPVAHIFVAVGVSVAWQWFEGKNAPRHWASLISIMFLVMVCFSAFTGYQDYFSAWARDGKQDLRNAFDVIFVDTAEAMNVLDRPQSVWILPVTPLAQSGSSHYTIDFLYQGSAPHHYLRVDESSVAHELSEVSQERSKALVIEWNESALGGAYLYNADPKGVLSFLLSKHGRLVEEREFEGFDVETYELPAAPYFVIAESFDPLSVNFRDELELIGLSYGGASVYETSTSSEVEKKVLPSGKSGWVVLRWRGLRAMAKDYKVGVYLIDGKERLIGQMDKLLLSNYLQPTSQWEPGQTEIDYYTLPSLPATPPGEYHIEVAVYDPESLERLPILGEIAGRQASTIGTLQIVKPIVPSQVEPQVWLGKKIAPGVRLLGYDLPWERVEPGGEIALTLYWEALEDVASDYLFSLELRDGEGQVWGEEVGRPVDGTYPTLEWKEGEVLRDWHKIRVEAGASEGTYALSLKVMERGRVVGEAALATIMVEGRPHQFAMPPIQYPLQARLGEGIKFLGYDLSAREVQAGEALELTLYWQALGEMEESYTVFTHLIDEGGRIWGQRDSIPGSGTLATTGWVEGEIITDEHELAVDPEALAGAYLIEVGMYLAETGERLPVYIGGERVQRDHLTLATLRVE